MFTQGIPKTRTDHGEEDSIAEQAANWLLALAQCSPDDPAHAEFDAWQRSDPRHAEAVEHMRQVVDKLQGLRHSGHDAKLMHAAIDAGSRAGRQKRKPVRKSLLLIAALAFAAPLWLTLKACPPSYLLADIRTPAGQARQETLADGTSVMLRGNSAINLRYDRAERQVLLERGEILVDVTRDAARPFVVVTGQGRFRALGTRFAVRRDSDSTVLTVLESQVQVSLSKPEGQGSPVAILAAGERIRVSDNHVGKREPVDISATSHAWASNQLVVLDIPLPEVLDELARQHIGLIHYDRAALANIRVSAVLPLGDVDQALQLLVNSHRLKIHGFTPWLLEVAVATPAK